MSQVHSESLGMKTLSICKTQCIRNRICFHIQMRGRKTPTDLGPWVQWLRIALSKGSNRGRLIKNLDGNLQRVLHFIASSKQVISRHHTIRISQIWFSLLCHLRSRKLRLMTVGVSPRWPRDTHLSTKVGTKFRRQVVVARYSLLAD
jgi:hypothetical protein